MAVRTYTEDYVSEAVNAAMNMILAEFEIDDEQEEVLALMVNATLTILGSEMKATIEDVIAVNYAVDVDEYKSERCL
jgi:outer membrane protein assembly factor BamD (BamD/ComL family)